MSTLFSCHYLRNRSTLDIGVWGCIGIVQHKEHSPEVVTLTRGTPCIWNVRSYVMFRYFCLFITHTCHLSAQNLSSMQYLSFHSMCSRSSLVVRTAISLTRTRFDRCIFLRWASSCPDFRTFSLPWFVVTSVCFVHTTSSRTGTTLTHAVPRYGFLRT